MPEAPGAGPKPGSNAFYAQLYGANERTVKRWKSTGRDGNEPTPLDNPELLRDWWTRHMKQRIPAGIDNACIQWRKQNPPSSTAPAPVLDLPVQAAAPPMAEEKAAARQEILDREVTDDEIGTEQTLRRLLEMEVRLSRFATDPGGAKPWLDTIARLGPMVEKLRKESEEHRKLIPRIEAETAIQSFHVPIKNEVYLMASTMCQVLGLPLTPDTEEKWRTECDRLFHRLNSEVLAA